MSYKCPDAPSHKAVIGLCKNILKAEVCSLIVRVRTKTMAELIEAAVKVEGILAELKKGSSLLPVITTAKDTVAKGKNKKEVFNTTVSRK